MSRKIKCPSDRSIEAHEKGLCECRDLPERSPMVQAMLVLYGPPGGKRYMRDRRSRRPKDAKRSWQRDHE
jgi:hypothetical protein